MSNSFAVLCRGPTHQITFLHRWVQLQQITGNEAKCELILQVWRASNFQGLPGRFGCDFINAIFNLVLPFGIFRSSYVKALRWLPQDLTDDKSTLVQVMACCRQTTSYYMSQCWPRSMSPTASLGHNGLNIAMVPTWHSSHNIAIIYVWVDTRWLPWCVRALACLNTTGNTLAKSQILEGVRASVPRCTIITQGRQAITESCGWYRVHNFSKPVTHKQKHRNRRISAQNVKNMLKFTPIAVSLPGNAVLRHNCTRSSTSLVIRESQMFPGPQIFRSQ